MQALPIAVQSVHEAPHATLALADAQPPSTQQVLQLLLVHGWDPESRGCPASVGGPESAPESVSPPPLLLEVLP